MPDNTKSLYTVKNRPYTAGNFEFRLDGEPTGLYLKSVEGGFIKAEVVDGPIGPNMLPIRHIATPKIDPISLEFGLSSSRGLMDWISKSWARKFARHDGQITHANVNYHESFHHKFYGALITETTFPSLDGASKEAGYIKCKLQPEWVEMDKVDTQTMLKTDSNETQKMWLPSKFRFTLDGISGMEYTNKLESFTIKQNVKELMTGKGRFPQYEPTKIDFPNISGQISLACADGLLAWYDKYVVSGATDEGAQVTGSIELLTPNAKTTLLTIKLTDVGIKALEIVKSDANSEQIKRVKFDLFVGNMALDLSSHGNYDTSF